MRKDFLCKARGHLWLKGKALYSNLLMSYMGLSNLATVQLSASYLHIIGPCKRTNFLSSYKQLISVPSDHIK